MRSNTKNIVNRMMEWRYENDGMEDDRRMVKKWRNWVIKKSVIMRYLLKKREEI